MGLLRRLIRKSIRKTFNNPTIKGISGENKISLDLDFLNLFGKNGVCLRNLYVPMRNGRTTEIDVVYITSKGIFVIESKNYSGYIFGNENQKYWTSTLYAGRGAFGRSKVEKHKFYNPIWQNRTHMNALRNYLGNVEMYSFVVFGNNCDIKRMSFDVNDVCVCYESNLKRHIKEILRNNPDIYDNAEITSIIQRLLPLTYADSETKRKHVEQIQNPTIVNENICPRCGGNLVLRTARKGASVGNQFYGCSNYPRCKYTRNLN